jgi:hypothetical protein
MVDAGSAEDPILVRAEMVDAAGPARGPAATEVQSPELPALCVGCGMRHGSQGAELNCLRIYVKVLRELAGRHLQRE